jgi:hypothetical protein
MRTILLLLAWQVTACLSAQTFNRTYGLAFPWEEVAGGRTIERNGTFYSLFRQRHLNTFDAYLVFQAVDVSGDTLFTTVLFDTVHPYSPADFQTSMITDALYASGLRANYQPLPYTHDWLIKYDLQGDTIWYREYSNSDSYYNFIIGMHIVLDSADNIIQLGSTLHDLVAPYDDQPAQIYLMKTDAAGNRLWDHTYGNPADNEQPQDHVQLPDGGYLIVGYNYFNQPNPPFYNIKTFLLRTDSLGNELYFNYLPGTNLDLVTIVSTNDDNYLLAGTQCNTNIDSCGVAVVKVDADGNILWQRTHWTDSTNSGIAILDDIVELWDGTVVGCGRLTPDPNDLDALGLVMKTDPAGYKLWSRTLDKTPSYDSFTRITACSDGGILMTGQMQRDQLSDVWLVKVDSNGCDSAGCPLDIHTGVTPVVTSSEDEKRYSVPDHCGPPTSRGETHVTLDVRDALGRVVRTERLPGASGNYTFTRGDLPTGVYTATLLMAGTPRTTIRLLIEH